MTQGGGELRATPISISHVYRLFHAVSQLCTTTTSPSAKVLISSTQGIKLSVQDASRVAQAHVFLTRNLFSSYSYTPYEPSVDDDDDEILSTFGIDLPPLVKCLQMFSTTTNTSFGGQATSDSTPQQQTCVITYKGTGFPLSIHFKEGNMTTRCDFQTYDLDVDDDDNNSDIVLSVDKLAFKAIMPAQVLEMAIRELTMRGGSNNNNNNNNMNESFNHYASSSPETLTIFASPDPPYFVISSSIRGGGGSAQIQLPKSRDILETFLVFDKVINRYPYRLVEKACEPLRLAHKVSLRCDCLGIMSIQCMCLAPDGNQSFIDFRFLPHDEDETAIYQDQQDENEQEQEQEQEDHQYVSYAASNVTLV